LSIHGHPGRPPLTVGGHIGEYVTGAYAALAAATAWRRASRTGTPEVVDVSMLEAIQMTHTIVPTIMARFPGGVPGSFFPKIQDVPIHIRGSYTRLGPVVPRGMPQFFADDKQPKIAAGSGRRELANWVASKDNLFTARVIVCIRPVVNPCGSGNTASWLPSSARSVNTSRCR